MPAPIAGRRRLGGLDKPNFTYKSKLSSPPAPAPSKPTPAANCCEDPQISSDEGSTICYNCGKVLDESEIVAEVTFGETAGGAAIVEGGFIGENQRHANSMGGTMRGLGGMPSREQSEMNGRTEIRKLCAALHIRQAVEDQAFSWYKLAINHSFVVGRRIRNVAAVAIYMAARRQPDNTLMLMDLSEKVQVNVWTLGDTYKSFLNKLMESDPAQLNGSKAVQEIEPLMLKYCRRLEFDEASHKVADDACKLLKRMKRDWMVQGRQPAGLCGACIILAARMNNFRRTVREVVYVVKVADSTINQRLYEYKRTPSSVLTVDQFREYGQRLKVTTQPPAIWRRAEREERKEERKRRATEDASSFEDEEDLVDPNAEDSQTETGSVKAPPSKKRKVSKGKAKAVASQDAVSNSTPRANKRRATEEPSGSEDGDGLIEPQAEGSQTETASVKAPPSKKRKVSKGKAKAVASQNDASQSASQGSSHENGIIVPDVDALEDAEAGLDAVANANAPDDADEEEIAIPKKRGRPPKKRDPIHISNEDLEIEQDIENEITQTVRDWEGVFKLFEENEKHEVFVKTGNTARKLAQIHMPNGNINDAEELEDDEFEDDPDVAACVLTPHEVRIKERIWITANEDWLREQQEKILKQALEEAQGKPKKPKQRRKHTQMGDGSVLEGQPATSAADAAHKMLKKRAKHFSHSINYDKLKELFPGGISTVATPAASTPGDSGQGASPAAATQPPANAPAPDAEAEEEEEYYDEEQYEEEEEFDDPAQYAYDEDEGFNPNENYDF